MNQDIEKNLSSLIQKIAPLPYVLKKLEETNIRYGLFAGSHVAILTGNRIPTDVDFIVHDDDLPRLKEAFPFAKTIDEGKAVYLYVGKDDVIEFMGKADVTKQDGIYPFRLTDLAVSRLASYKVDGYKATFVDPVDTLLLKAILRRGAEQGKHDLEDIKAVLAKTKLNLAYLNERLREANALTETKPVWQEFGVSV